MMLLFRIVEFYGTCVTFGLTHYISFDEYFVENQTIKGLSNDQALSWTIVGLEEEGRPLTDRTIPDFLAHGFNATSLFIKSSTTIGSIKLQIIQNSNFHYLQNNAQQLIISFWMFLSLKKIDFYFTFNERLLLLANGLYWSNPNWRWFYYIKLINHSVYTIKTLFVNSRTEEAFTFTYPISLTINFWNFIILTIDADGEDIRIEANLKCYSGFKSNSENVLYQTDRNIFVKFQLSSLSSNVDSFVVIVDDLFISDVYNHSYGTSIQKYDKMFYCPQDVNSEFNSMECKCWKGFLLKTDNLYGICRNSLTCCVDDDECVNGAHNCPDNSECENIVGSFVCISRFANGQCTKQADHSWKCDCKLGFTGKFCEYQISDICHCKNEGNCTSDNQNFKCFCAEGFVGELCEINAPVFKLTLPVPPYYTNNTFTFVASTTDIGTKNSNSTFKFVWNFGDGAAISNSRLFYSQEGLIKFYTKINLKLNNNVSVPVFWTSVEHCFTNAQTYFGSLSIYQNLFLSQTIRFRLDLLHRSLICKPFLYLNNIFSENKGIAVIGGTRSVVVTSTVMFPPQCPHILKINYDWNLFAKNNNNSKLIEMSLITDQYYFKIPTRKLKPGSYKLLLKVIVETMNHETFFSQSSGIIDLRHYKICANIFGGVQRTVPAKMDVILNAFLPHNIDIDEGDKFNWYCWLKNGQQSEFCLGKEIPMPNQNSELIIPGKYMMKGQTYFIKVSLNNFERSNISPRQFVQEIYVRDERLALITIKCLENCEGKSSPMINIILYVIPSNRRVKWSVELDGAKIRFHWKKNTCPTRNSSMLCIKPKSLLSGHIYQFRATFVNVRNNEDSFAIYQIEMAEEIAPGTCTVEPEVGVTFADHFDVECNGFTENDLTYEIYQRILFTRQKVSIGRNALPQFHNLTLSSGDEKDNYQTELIVIAKSPELAETRVYINVTVLPMSLVIGSNAVPYLIQNAINAGLLEQLKLSGNIMGAVQMISAITNTLEYETSKDNNSEGIGAFAQIRHELVDNLENNLPFDLLTIQQSASLLEQILNTSLKQLYSATQQKAVQLVENLTIILREESEKENIDTTQRMNNSQYILRAINDLFVARAKAVISKNLTVKQPIDYDDRDYFEISEDGFTSQKNATSKEKSFEIDLSSRTFEVMRKLDIVVQGVYQLKLDTTLKAKNIRSTVYSNIHKIITKNREVHGKISYAPETYSELMKTNHSLGLDKFDFNPLPNQPLATYMNTPFIKVGLRNVKMDDVSTADKNLTVNLFFQRPANQPLINQTISVSLQESTEILVHTLELPTLLGFLIIKIEPEIEIPLKVTITSGYRPSLYDFDNKSYVLPKKMRANDTTTFAELFTIVVPVEANSTEDDIVYLGILANNNYSYSFTYAISVSFANCYSWDEELKTWSTKGCSVGINSDSNYLHCNCSHMSLFGGSILICPNLISPISFFLPLELLRTQTTILDIYLFLTIVDNPIMLIALIVIYVIYFILLPLAKRFDKKSQQKGIIVLEDNFNKKYFYAIVVSTGYQRGAGTTAHIAMQIKGDQGQTRVFILGHPTWPIFHRGGIDAFLLATETSLGNINEILIFHDSFGLEPNWFLRSILVHDTHQNRQWTFSIYRWLTLSKVKNEFIFEFKGEENEINFGNEFKEKLSEKLCDEHLLYSIFHKPDFSRFTCVQRLSCLLCVRLLTMLVSLMFYGVPRDGNVAQIEVGEFRFSFRQIVIGMESSLIVVPISFILIFLFKRTRPKFSPYISKELSEKQPLNSAKIDPQTSIQSKPSNKEKNDIEHFEIASSSNEILPLESKLFETGRSTSVVESKSEKTALSFNKKTFFRSDFELPYWCLYVAWTLVIACSVISSYMIILYGLRYGRVRSLNWLVSTVTGMLQGFILQEPLIMVLRVLLIMTISKLIAAPVKKKKEKLPFDVVKIQSLEKGKPTDFKFQKQRYYLPIRGPDLDELKHRVLVQRETSIRILEIIGFLIFFITLWIIVFEVKNPDAFQVTRYVAETFVNYYRSNSVSDYAIRLNQVKDIGQIYRYLDKTLLYGLHEDQHKMDNSIQLLGVARLRQLRVKSVKCEGAQMFNDSIDYCAPNYYIWLNDNKPYLPTWIPWNQTANGSIAIKSPWIHITSDYILPYIIYGHLGNYPDFGYIAELGKNLKNSRSILQYLAHHNWIDHFSRAIFCEFTLYNVPKNYFSQVTIVFEIAGTGAIFTDYRISTFRPFGYFQHFTLPLTISFILFTILFILYFIWEIVKLTQLGRSYFKDRWNIVDIAILLGCVLLFTFYGIYYGTVSWNVKKIHQSKKNAFVSFFPALIWDTISTATFALIVCLNMSKAWKLLTFNKHMYSFILTLQSSAHAIFNFTIMYMIVITAFVYATFIMLGPYVYVFQSVSKSYLNYILFSFGRTSFRHYVAYNPVAGLVLFFLFTFIVYYYLMNMFVAIIMNNFQKARKKIESMRNKYEIVKYFREKLFVIIKFGSLDEDAKRNQLWLEIDEKMSEINRLCEVILKKVDR